MKAFTSSYHWSQLLHLIAASGFPAARAWNPRSQLLGGRSRTGEGMSHD